MSTQHFKLLGLYLHGLMYFEKEVNTGKKIYKKGDMVNVTASTIFMAGANIIKPKDFSLVLRRFDQLEDKEFIELCDIVTPEQIKQKSVKKVTRIKDKKGKTAEVEIKIVNGKISFSFHINEFFEMSILRKIQNDSAPFLVGGTDAQIDALAVQNQAAAYNWLINKQLDVLNLIGKGEAKGLEKWGLSEYAKFKNYF